MSDARSRRLLEANIHSKHSTMFVSRVQPKVNVDLTKYLKTLIAMSINEKKENQDRLYRLKHSDTSTVLYSISVTSMGAFSSH